LREGGSKRSGARWGSAGRATRSAPRPSAVCLTLILACIVYWQAREISRVLSQSDPEAAGVDLSLLEHVSPIEWDNVVLYGQYILDRKLVRRCRRTLHRRRTLAAVP
jgi:hypothetical protein